MSSIVHLYLNRRTRNGGRIHDVNDVFSQIRLPSPILPSFISYDRMSILHRLLITTSFAVGVVQQMFWTHTNNEGQSIDEKKFSSEKVSVSFTFLLSFVHSFLRSLVIDLYTFHTCLLMMHLTYPDRFIPSFGQFNTRQTSENDRQWYRIGCFEILYNHLTFASPFFAFFSLYCVCPTYFIFMCICTQLDDKVKKQFVLYTQTQKKFSSLTECQCHARECLIKSFLSMDQVRRIMTRWQKASFSSFFPIHIHRFFLLWSWWGWWWTLNFLIFFPSALFYSLHRQS